ncbi:dTDP-4-dehydrorhamnose 3,5-epimerase [Schlesneria paludicola]|uniref:dTDP-4-dehydrorhamnose 3,5-epimerase n=1 Tax=Schlesneria paludicola TaxID=360056 RepID=UPI00029B2152|nr:dTDP-4-dehydrorhamnose 3,5-epimerase [Schlesneria paludicola]
MIFRETPLRGAYLIEPERMEDPRGFFARSWCQREFAERGLCDQFTQCNISFNHKAGTVRGMHYQAAPHAETKLVRCTAGAIYDVIVDMRPVSPTYRQWFAAELSAENRQMLYIPEEFAHGFQTLTDQSEVFYQMSHEFHASSSRGFRWNDEKIGISWPSPVTVIGDKDQNWPAL